MNRERVLKMLSEMRVMSIKREIEHLEVGNREGAMLAKASAGDLQELIQLVCDPHATGELQNFLAFVSKLNMSPLQFLTLKSYVASYALKSTFDPAPLIALMDKERAAWISKVS